MDGKSVFVSKMVIVNGLVLAVSALTAISNHQLVAENPKAVLWITSGIGLINILLRLITTEPIKMN